MKKLSNDFNNNVDTEKEVMLTSTSDCIPIEISKPKVLIGTQPIRIKVEQYHALVDIASQTGRDISDIASILIDFAIKHTEIKHQGNR